jgi:hypothetical protein
MGWAKFRPVAHEKTFRQANNWHGGWGFGQFAALQVSEPTIS